MIKFNKTRLSEQQIPSGAGIYTISDSDSKILYINKTSSLDKSIRHLFKATKDDKIIFQLVSQCTEIGFEEHTSLFSALVQKKITENISHAEFNSLIKFYNRYVYLGIDFNRPPYVKIAENTQQDRFYIGPFKDRFFLYDFLDALAELFQFPLCPDEKPYPCSRYKEEKCQGWCLKERNETYQHAILPYIFPDQILLNSQKKEQHKLFDDLQFEKAEKLKNKLILLERYFEQLKFINITKNLNLEFKETGRKYIIKNGLLSGIVDNEKNEEFPIISVEFRDNEVLAFNKDQLAERWIIYKYLINKNDKIILDIISEFYKKSQLKLRSLLS